MRLTIAAIGRLKAGPERVLLDRYLDRATALGRRLGLTVSLREFPESHAGSASARKDQEAAAILAAIPTRAIVVALDEGGRSLTSANFAARIGAWRDGGEEGLCFAIGGADGHGQALLARATLKLAFGAETWPHQLVRIMLAEQLYRATTILAGHPYHRE